MIILVVLSLVFAAYESVDRRVSVVDSLNELPLLVNTGAAGSV